MTWETLYAYLGPPEKLKTFEANRVSEIITTLTNVCLQYVSSAENPTDCATHGLSAEKLET